MDQVEQKDKKYEISFLATKESDRGEVVDTLSKYSASIIDENQPSRTKLAYQIKKEAFGFLGGIFFSVDPLRIEEIKSDLRMKSSILRFLIVSSLGLKSPRSTERTRTFIRKAEKRKEQIILSTEAGQVDVVVSQDAVKKPQPKFTDELTNEALEKKLEELLK
ncbi:30S ribosomal protein S6 [Candidatus Wolfebacteria bacterium]|nr:30S ribosomal protein S6 [Candidatus Wolfebacteria bacterium]